MGLKAFVEEVGKRALDKMEEIVLVKGFEATFERKDRGEHRNERVKDHQVPGFHGSRRRRRRRRPGLQYWRDNRPSPSSAKKFILKTANAKIVVLNKGNIPKMARNSF